MVNSIIHFAEKSTNIFEKIKFFFVMLWGDIRKIILIKLN